VRNRKQRSVIGLLGILVLLLTLVGVMPAGAAATGTVTLDKPYITTPGGAITVTLTDGDVDVAVTQTGETVDYDGTAYAFPFTSGDDAGTLATVRVKKFPILDKNGDGFVNFQDVSVSISDLQIFTISAADGLVTVRAKTAEATAVSTAYTLTYDAADVQNTATVAGTGAVKITSTQDATGFVLVLKETGAATGKFTATFKTGGSTSTTGASDPTNATRPTIATVSGATITASYTDASPAGTRSAATTVETTKPTVSVVSPGTSSSTQNVNPKLTANFTDGDSGIDKTTIAFTITSGNATVGTITTSAIAGGYQAETTLSGLAAGETTVTWYGTANDKAGNTGRSDSAAATTGDQDHSVKVDTVAPDFSSAVTGQWWDAAKTTTNKTETSVAKAKDTSIKVTFNEALDGTSISSSDFKVTLGSVTVAVLQADHYAGASSDVFLTIPAGTISANSRPKVALSSDGALISDKAGNPRTTSANSPTAKDGIAPTIDVTVSPTLTKKTATLDVSSNEALLTAPAISVNAAAQIAPSLVGTNLFRLSYSNTLAGLYNVEVSSLDTASNTTASGKTAATTTGAIKFEIDNALPAVSATLPANGASVYTASPFFTIDWASEGTEYTGDTHKKVTLSKLTLDGTDVLASVSTVDDIEFVLATAGLALGSHSVVFNATDEVGNKLAADVTVKFTVKERPAFKVSMLPGWNLISIPGYPADPAINSVIGATHPIDAVLTYNGSEWLTANRDAATGLLTGTLTTISSTQAYWVHTNSFKALDITLASVGTGQVPPTIELSAGWNLVPVLAANPQTASAGNTVNEDNYLPSGWARAYSYATLTGQFGSISPSDSGSNLLVGQGYWVYMTKTGNIIP